MGKETTQPTPIDKDEYKAFKNWVRDVHGKTRGHLGSEIENALREYRKNDSAPDRLRRMENDIATIKANIADAESDGGAVASTPSEASDTRAREISKPAANQPRQKKIDYILQELDFVENQGSAHPNVIKNTIKSEFSFNDDTANEYVELVFDRLGATRVDESDIRYWGDSIEDRRNELREETESEMERVE